MSFDLETYVPSIQKNLAASWQRKLRFVGLCCEFHPDFDPTTWRGSFWPVKIDGGEKVPNFSIQKLATVSGLGPWLSGFAMDIVEFDPATESNTLASGKAANAIKKSNYLFLFQTKLGRTVLDHALQCYAAATLAAVSNGVLHDPQTGQCFMGKSAIAYANRCSDAFETSSYESQAWRFQQFPGWKPLKHEDKEALKKPRLRDLVSAVGEMQLKNVTFETACRFFSQPIIFAHSEGLTVTAKGFHKLYRPWERDKAIREYKSLLDRCGYRYRRRV